MADITLRDYIARLDQLLADGNISEVIHHCRHILQFYPRHATVYRFLGRALLESHAYPQASEVLRRVLSVYPDDLMAHAGLSEVYSEDRRFDDAIWHLERAFENDPNNQAILDRLRELYRRHRRVEHVRVQLTAGAVARQYLRNGLHAQAVETLHQALDRSPDRVDLKLLLAEAYWNAGQSVEAAEQAVEILRVLPDCFEANRMLSELWLAEGRPTDAQRYINRLQSLDPYLALQLAKDQEVPDTAFRLSELDYRRAAEQEMVNQTPDWLDDISQASASFAFAAEAEQQSADELPELEGTGFSGRPPDDWFAELPATPAPAESPASTPRRRTGLTGLLSHYDQPEAETAEPVAAEPTDQAEIESLFPLPVETPADAAEAAPAADRSPIIDLQPDPLSWLKEHGVEMTGDEQVARLRRSIVDEEPTGGPAGAQAADPLAWLDDFGGKAQLLTEDVAAAPIPLSDDMPAAAADDEMDPLAWLRDTSAPPEEPSAATVPAAPQGESGGLDWLRDDSMLHEALDLEALVGGSVASPAETGADDVSATIERQGEMTDEKDLFENDLPWSESDQDDLSRLEPMLDHEAPLSADEQAPDWLAEANPQPETELTTSPQPDLEFPDWMNELPPPETNAEPAAEPGADIPDWFAEMQPGRETPAEQLMTEAAPVADEVGPEWMARPDAAAEPVAELAEDIPDWLTEMQPEQAVPAEEPVAEAAPVADEAGFEWMARPEAAAEPVAELAEDIPGWLTEMQPEQAAPAEEPVAEAAPAADEAGFEWMAQPAAAAEPVAELAEDIPDWLTRMQPESAAPAEEPVAEAAPVADDAGFEWMAQPEAAAEPVAELADDIPDWLTEMQHESAAPAEEPIAEAAPVANEAGFEWMAQPEAAAEPVAELAEDIPDWLTEMQPEQTAPAEEPVAEAAPVADEAGFEWMAQPAAAAEPVAELAEDIPDWLTEMQSEQAAPAEEPVAEIAEPVAELSEDAPDWLTQIRPESPAEAHSDYAWSMEGDAQVDSASLEQPSWLMQLEHAEAAASSLPDAAEVESVTDQSGPETGSEDMPEWLAQLRDSEATPAPEQVRPRAAQTVRFDDDETMPWEAQPAAEMEAEPVADEHAVSEVTTAPAGDAGWIDEINAISADFEGAADTMPAASGLLAAARFMPATDEGMLAAPEFIEEGEPAGFTPAANAPDWLNAMVPGLDVDFGAAEDAPIETEFVEGSENRLEPEYPETRRSRAKREFDWLANLVDEETRQGRAVLEGVRTPRFVFSKKPIWLREPVEQPDAQPPVAGSDADDTDLPPWMQ